MPRIDDMLMEAEIVENPMAPNKFNLHLTLNNTIKNMSLLQATCLARLIDSAIEEHERTSADI